MRLFLLPVSTRRTLLYCERLGEAHGQRSNLVDKAQARAARLWADWEKKPTGSWQHRVVSSGNAALRRIAFEEWGLKSVPPLSARRRVELAAAANKDNAKISEAAPVEVVYPPSVIPAQNVSSLLSQLSTEREALHRKRLIWCFVGMPITAPFAIIPLIPNIPFFYLAYRAWSHWRALSGGKHIQYLLQNKGLVFSSSPILDAIYAQERTSNVPGEKPTGPISQAEEKGEERLLLSHPSSSKAIADAFDSPSLELELERAIWQVETALEKESNEKKVAEKQQTQHHKQPLSKRPPRTTTEAKDREKK